MYQVKEFPIVGIVTCFTVRYDIDIYGGWSVFLLSQQGPETLFHLISDLQMLPLEKSHSSPGSSKSSSDGQLRSHGPSRSQSKSSVTQAHLEDAGIAIAAAEAAVQQSRLQPSKSHPYL